MADETKDQRIAGASYIVTFFNDVEALNWQAPAYINLITQFKFKYPQKGESGRPEESDMDIVDQTNLQSSVQMIKTYVFRVYTKFRALSKQIDQFDEYKDIMEKGYKAVSGEAIPSQEVIEGFVITVNELFVMGIVGELLGSASEVLRTITG